MSTSRVLEELKRICSAMRSPMFSTPKTLLMYVFMTAQQKKAWQHSELISFRTGGKTNCSALVLGDKMTSIIIMKHITQLYSVLMFVVTLRLYILWCFWAAKFSHLLHEATSTHWLLKRWEVEGSVLVTGDEKSPRGQTEAAPPGNLQRGGSSYWYIRR